MGLWGGQALPLQNISPITKTYVYACVCVKPRLGALTSSHMDAYAGHLEWELGWEAKRSEDLQVPFPRAQSPGH